MRCYGWSSCCCFSKTERKKDERNKKKKYVEENRNFHNTHGMNIAQKPVLDFTLGNYFTYVPLY